MNEQLQNTVNEILIKSIDAFYNGVEWLAGEIPEVVSQLLLWNLASSLLWAIAWIMVSISFALSYKKLIAQIRGGRGDYEEMVLPMFTMLWGIAAIIGVFSSIHCFEIALKILIAPKLYLLEYASELI